jgi:type II secretory ATPase GspE/PulE/Tfp pilus assembly ATPase PilB-like protein
MNAALLSASLQYGSYISIIKFISFLALFLLWLPIVNWVYRDAQAVGTRKTFWTAIVFFAGAVTAVVWLLMPLFVIGILLYLIAVAATSIVYAMHRDSKVTPFERVLSIDHVKSIIARDKVQATLSHSGTTFVTANDNEVPLPERKTPEFFGYKVATEIFKDALWRRTSDISFSPSTEGYNIVYRIDGVASKQPGRTREETEYFIRFTKHLADLDVNERRKPQKGKFKIQKDSNNIDWEVTTAGSTSGEQIQIRRCEQYSLMKLEDLGLSAEQVEQLGRLKKEKRGVFIVSGPKQTGVTTTFYALLRSHDPFLYNINTLEKQPSADLSNITQDIYSLSDTGTTTYAQRLQSVLRLDPDILGVADCDEQQTALVITEAAKRDKLIYVTLEAPNVTMALTKWLKLVGDKNLLADTLFGISNQRLLRRICDKCKEAYEPNKEILKKFNIPAEKIKIFYRPVGTIPGKRGKPVLCEHCQGTGFFGRKAVFETIIINSDLRKAIKLAKTMPEIGTAFRRARMLYMQEQAIRNVADGTTSINEVIREFSTGKKSRREAK